MVGDRDGFVGVAVRIWDGGRLPLGLEHHRAVGHGERLARAVDGAADGIQPTVEVVTAPRGRCGRDGHRRACLIGAGRRYAADRIVGHAAAVAQRIGGFGRRVGIL